MPQQPISSVENNFTQGFKTEYTGLNFPENAATETDNCVYTLVGNVTRRKGINFEENYTYYSYDRSNKAFSTFLWNNAGGDGNTELFVTQIGSKLFFYKVSSATVSLPISRHLLSKIIDLMDYRVVTAFDETQECEFASGNGNLYVFHPNISPIYVEYYSNNDTLAADSIDIQTRDFVGLPDYLDINTRPINNSISHNYNLQNQGWTSGSSWGAYSESTVVITSGSNKTFIIDQSGLPISPGEAVRISSWYFGGGISLGTLPVMTGTVVDYNTNTLVINITSIDPYVQYLLTEYPYLMTWSHWRLEPISVGYARDFYDDVGVFPSNADVWWVFKDSTGAFNPATTVPNTPSNTGFAPKGHFILSEFQQDRASLSGIPELSVVSTNKRPRIGTWFQGRVWYAGVDDTRFGSGTSTTYSWTERIYFSQTIVNNTQLGYCYQANDPTSETLFDLLPTDGGSILIQGCGKINKLFPIQNGLLVFAYNGIYFITGSRGIGFAANDYTITQISKIRTQSSTSFVNVQGLPYFWNEEGIYTVVTAQEGLGLQVVSLTLESIQSYYDDIPDMSKLYVRGDYNPIDYTIYWLFKSNDETSVTDRYEFDKVLIFNVAKKSFYVYTITGNPKLHAVDYIPGYGRTDSPPGGFKFYTSYSVLPNYYLTFSEEYDNRYLDWWNFNGVGEDYESYFITGYKLHGQGQRRFQIDYIYVYSNAEEPTAYKIQGIWDYANDRNSGKWTTVQLVTNALTRFSKIFRRHKIRGRGLVLQFKISSYKGMNFDINGWSVRENQNTNV